MISIFKVIFAALPLVLLMLWGVNHFVIKTKDLPLFLDVKSRPYQPHTGEAAAESEEIADGEKVAKEAAGSDDAVETVAESSSATLLEEDINPKDSERADSDAELILDAESNQALELAAAAPVDGFGDTVTVANTGAVPSTTVRTSVAVADESTEGSAQDSSMEVATKQAPTIKPSLEARKQAIRERLGISNAPPPAPTPAIDVQYIEPSGCRVSDVALAPVTVSYRFNSPAIKGRSLNVLETIIAEYRLCGGGSFKMSRNPLAKADESPALTQRRLDELKYFFIQHSVPKSALEYPEDL